MFRMAFDLLTAPRDARDWLHCAAVTVGGASFTVAAGFPIAGAAYAVAGRSLGGAPVLTQVLAASFGLACVFYLPLGLAASGPPPADVEKHFHGGRGLPLRHMPWPPRDAASL